MSPKRYSLMVAACFVAALLAPAGPAASAAATISDREEINESYDLSMGSRVRISGINGSVHIETWNQPKADIHIVKTARDGAEDLKRVEVIIDHSSDRLDIRTRKDDDDEDVNVTVRLDVKLPRQMNLRVSGVNGPTDIGAVEGPVEVNGINGRVRIDQASDQLTVSGVNGSVQAMLANVSSPGIKVSGVNGSVVLGLPDSLNADIDVTGHNGGVDTEMPVSVRGLQRRHEFHGQVGSGGTPINISGVNGSIRFRKGAAM